MTFDKQEKLVSHTQLQLFHPIIMKDEQNTLHLEIYSGLVQEIKTFNEIVNAKSVRFCESKKIIPILTDLGSHLKSICSSFEPHRDEENIEVFLSLICVNYNVRSGFFLDAAEEFDKCMHSDEEVMGVFCSMLSKHAKEFASNVAGLQANGGDDVKKLALIVYQEARERYSLSKNLFRKADQNEENIVVAFILKKYAKVVREQARVIQSFIMDTWGKDSSVTDFDGFRSMHSSTTFEQLSESLGSLGLDNSSTHISILDKVIAVPEKDDELNRISEVTVGAPMISSQLDDMVSKNLK